MAGTPGRSGGNRSLKGDFTKADGLPVAPDGRDEKFYATWDGLIGKLQHDVLRQVDVFQLSILVDLLNEIYELGDMLKSDPDNLKIRSLRLRLTQQVTRLSAQFGLSPMDRQRIEVPEPEKEEDPFESLSLKIAGAG